MWQAHQQVGHAFQGAPGSSQKGAHRAAGCCPQRDPRKLPHCSNTCMCWRGVPYHLVAASSCCIPVPAEPVQPAALSYSELVPEIRQVLQESSQAARMSKRLRAMTRAVQVCHTWGCSCFHVCNHAAACWGLWALAPPLQISAQLPSHRVCTARRSAARWAACAAACGRSDGGHTPPP